MLGQFGGIEEDILGQFGGIEEDILGQFGGIEEETPGQFGAFDAPADMVGASAGAAVPHWRTDLGVTARADAPFSLTPWKGCSEGFDCKLTY